MPNIREMQRQLSQWATDHPEGRYRDLFNLVCDPGWLLEAYYNISLNKGANTPGVDGITHRKWERNLAANMEQLCQGMRDGTYRPQPCRRVYIPKRGGKHRPLGIPTIRDRIVQEAIRMAIEPIFEAGFLGSSHGFRPNRSTHDAAIAVRAYMVDHTRMYYVIEGDIKGYFDTIHHRKLMTLLRRRIGDKRVLDIIWLFLKAGIMEDGLFAATEQGTPQGGVISPLLANIYLHEFDRYFYDRFTARTAWHKHKCRRDGGNNAAYVRYADDFVVLCNGHISDVRKLKEEIAAFLQNELHLVLSEEKTAITHVNEGFDFLGFRFFRGLDRTGKWKPRMAIPEAKAASIKERIRALTEHDQVHQNEAAVVAKLNAVLRGWGNYYRYLPAYATFSVIDQVAYHRLIRWYANKYKWSRAQVIVRRQTRTIGNKRLYALWQSREGPKQVTLFKLSRDIGFHTYYPRKKLNPFLVDQETPMTEKSRWKAGCGESRTSGLGEGVRKQAQCTRPCAALLSHSLKTQPEVTDADQHSDPTAAAE